MHVQFTLSRLAVASATISVALTVLGTVAFLAGSLAYHALGSGLGACLIFTGPACVLFLYSVSRVRAGEFLPAALASIVGGLIMGIAAIAAAISSAYASPCFEIARCTRGETFEHLALTTAMTVFWFTAAAGFLVTPIVLSLGARRRVPA